jgi:hypothetical protein
LNSHLEKQQRNLRRSRRSPPALACIDHKSPKICDRCRLGTSCQTPRFQPEEAQGLPWETRPNVTSLEGAPGLRELVSGAPQGAPFTRWKRESSTSSSSRTRTIPEGLRGWRGCFFARFAICWHQSIRRVLIIALCSSRRISPLANPQIVFVPESYSSSPSPSSSAPFRPIA